VGAARIAAIIRPGGRGSDHELRLHVRPRHYACGAEATGDRAGRTRGAAAIAGRSALALLERGL